MTGNDTNAKGTTMHKAKKVSSTGHMENERYEYRGGFIERFPSVTGRRSGNWEWGVCGVVGWVDNKSEAKDKIDRLLAAALVILQSEQAFRCEDDQLCRHGVEG